MSNLAPWFQIWLEIMFVIGQSYCYCNTSKDNTLNWILNCDLEWDWQQSMDWMTNCLEVLNHVHLSFSVTKIVSINNFWWFVDSLIVIMSEERYEKIFDWKFRKKVNHLNQTRQDFNYSRIWLTHEIREIKLHYIHQNKVILSILKNLLFFTGTGACASILVWFYF